MSQEAQEQTVEAGLIVSTYIDAELKRELSRLARESERTLSAEVRLALKRHVESERRAA